MIEPANPQPNRVRPAFILAGWVICIAVCSFVTVGLLRNPPPTTTKVHLADAAQADLEKRSYRPISTTLRQAIRDPNYESIPTQVHPLLGQSAPDFTLKDTNDQPIALAEQLKNGPVVVVFYYGYHCNHCVSQLFGLQKDMEKFRELGVTVLAISADPSELTRDRFQEYGSFAYPVLSDPGNQVAEKYGTYRPSTTPGTDGDLMHGTFIISPKGTIVWTNRGDSPFVENRTLLVEIARMMPNIATNVD